MKRYFSLLIVTGIFLMVGCGQKKKHKENVAIVVNGYEITSEEVKKAAEILKESLVRVFPEKAISGFDPAELSAGAAEQLISHRVLVDEAKKLGIKANKDAVDSSFAIIKNRFPTSSDFEEELKKAGETDSSLKAQLSESHCINELIKKVIEKAPSVDSSECKNFYEKHKDKYVGKGRVKVRWILFPLVNVKNEEEKQKIKAKADEAYNTILTGKMNFKECAK
ncbi:MAG: SurA N-terminal domain-containing protein, partial [Chitinispirillaceae bacterium]|nr:SurA N-terminal domain-containing protein [Chitinispirillaceae bacterium]